MFTALYSKRYLLHVIPTIPLCIPYVNPFMERQSEARSLPPTYLRDLRVDFAKNRNTNYLWGVLAGYVFIFGQFGRFRKSRLRKPQNACAKFSSEFIDTDFKIRFTKRSTF